MKDAAQRLLAAIGAVEQELIEPRAQAEGDRLHFPTRLNVKLVGLSSVVSTAAAGPTRQATEVFAELSVRVDQDLSRWRAPRDGHVAAFSDMIRCLAVRP